MRLTLLVLVITLVGAYTGAAAQVQTLCAKNRVVSLDGECWNSLSPLEKTNTIRGMWAGMATNETSAALSGDASLHFFERDWSATPESTTIADLMGYFDRLYSTPANRPIQWRWAYILAAMEARDDDSDDRLSLIRFLRQNENVPTSGVLVGARTADTVIVRSNDKDYDIHIDGVSAAGLTDKQRHTATAFLNGLAKSSFTDCDDASATFVKIIYDWSMFQGDNRLSGGVLIQTPNICIGKAAVSISDIIGSNVSVLNVGYAMLTRGLAYQDKYVDPKWPEDASRDRRSDYNVRKAREQALYVYGGEEVPAVEKIIRANASR